LRQELLEALDADPPTSNCRCFLRPIDIAGA
jgi:hypothetical protein